MSLMDIKEKISRLRFFVDKVKYKREKHFYFAIFGLIFCLVGFFTIVYINQQVEIKRKENILRSYYPENDIESSAPEGSAARIIDLLKIAGGQTENSCLEIINLAQIVIDGQRIYIPSLEEIGDSDSLFFTEDSDDYGFPGNGPVNINTAGSKELESLPGIGPVIANNIVEYRSRNGAFKKKEELKNVTGIGEKKYEEIEKLVSI